MHPSLTHPDTSPFVRYLRESGEVEVVPCSTTKAIHLETLRLRVNNWLGRPDQLGVGFFYKMVSDVSAYFGLAVISQSRRKLVLGLRFTDGTPPDEHAPKFVNWKLRLQNLRNDIASQYWQTPILPGFPTPFPDHTTNGYKGQYGRRLKQLLDAERRLCWHQRIAEASEQHKFVPLYESEDDVFERLNRFSAADLDILDTKAGEGQLFTALAAEFGISSGGWLLLCDQYKEFNMLDFGLYLMAIEPQVQAWATNVNTARKKLSSLSKKCLK